jgi:hypothetical protein
MFPQHSQSCEELNIFNRIAVKETCVSIVLNVVLIGQIIVTHIAGFDRVTPHWIGYFIQPIELSMRWSEVAEDSHCRVPELLVDSISAPIVLHAPVC